MYLCTEFPVNAFFAQSLFRTRGALNRAEFNLVRKIPIQHNPHVAARKEKFCFTTLLMLLKSSPLDKKVLNLKKRQHVVFIELRKKTDA
jgi:hypothetical protein